jgi:hypothetical protein
MNDPTKKQDDKPALRHALCVKLAVVGLVGLVWVVFALVALALVAGV